MKMRLWMVAMVAVMMSWGCSPDEKKSEDKVAEQSSVQTMVETLEETEAPQEGSSEPGRDSGPAITGTDEVVDEQNSAEQERLPTTTATVNDGSQAINEVVTEKNEIESETPAFTENEMEPVEQKEEEQPEAVESGQSLATIVETIVINNDHGKVVLQHQKHAEAFGCSVCHEDQQPGPLELGKDKAHALCQGCHKEKNAGPTSCLKCHQKKEQAVEGC